MCNKLDLDISDDKISLNGRWLTLKQSMHLSGSVIAKEPSASEQKICEVYPNISILKMVAPRPAYFDIMLRKDSSFHTDIMYFAVPNCRLRIGFTT